MGEASHDMADLIAKQVREKNVLQEELDEAMDRLKRYKADGLVIEEEIRDLKERIKELS